MNILAYVHLRNIHRSTGAGRVAQNIIEALVDQNTDDIRILGDASDHGRVLPLMGEPWAAYKYCLFNNDTSVQQRQWLVFHGPKAEKFWPEVELVYCAGESFVPTRKARTVTLIHDAAYFDEGAHEASIANLPQRLKWRILFDQIARSSDLIHTVSEFSAERLQRHFPAMKGRLRVVHNAVSANFFSTDRSMDAAILERLGLTGRRFILLPRGLWFRKNGDLVLEAWPRIRQNEEDLLLVVTSHNDPVYSRRASILNEGIVETGFIEDDKLRALYRAAQVVWVPSRYEGFGIPVLEAMACGTSVVASNSSSLPEVAGNAAVLVETQSVSEHVDAIQALLNSDAQRARYRELGFMRAAGFTWQRSAQTLRAAFSELE